MCYITNVFLNLVRPNMHPKDGFVLLVWNTKVLFFTSSKHKNLYFVTFSAIFHVVINQGLYSLFWSKHVVQIHCKNNL